MIMYSKKYEPFLGLIILFSNLKIVALGGRVVTGAECLMLLWILRHMFTIKVDRGKAILLFAFIAGFPALSMLASTSTMESLKAVIPLVFYAAFAFTFVDAGNERRDRIVRTFVITNACIAIYAILQAILVRLVRIPIGGILAHPFGPFTALRGEMEGLAANPLLWRSNGVFSEPSLLGLFSLASICLLDAAEFRRKKSLGALFILAIGSSLSGSTLIGLACVIFLKVFASRGYVGLKVLLVGASIPAAVFVFVPVFSRLGEIFIPGTSGYMRITAPLKYVLYVLSHSLMGTGIGAVDVYLRNIPDPVVLQGFALGSGDLYIQVSNTLLLWLIAYGYLAVPALGMFIFILYKLAKASTILVAFVVLLFHASTGSFYSTIHWVFLMPFIAML